MADLFATDSLTNPQDQGIGNLFGEGMNANRTAQQAMLQRQMQMQEAQLSPAQAAAFRSAQAGSNIGKAIGGLFNPQQVDPRQAKLASIKQAVDQEAQQAGINDPADYLRLASSRLLQAGEYQFALEAKKQSDSLMKSDLANKKTKAEISETEGKSLINLSKAELEQFKLGAEIDKLEAEAKKLKAETGVVKPADRESLNEQAARITEFIRLQTAQGKAIHPADIKALETIKDLIKPEPMPTIQSALAQRIQAQGAAGAASKYQTDAQGFVNIPVGQPIPKDLPKGTKIKQGSRTGTIK